MRANNPPLRRGRHVGRNRQDRTRSFAQHLLGDRTGQEPIEPAAVVGSHHDEVYRIGARSIGDDPHGIARRGLEADGETREHFLRHRPAHLSPHFLGCGRLHGDPLVPGFGWDGHRLESRDDVEHREGRIVPTGDRRSKGRGAEGRVAEVGREQDLRERHHRTPPLPEVPPAVSPHSTRGAGQTSVRALARGLQLIL